MLFLTVFLAYIAAFPPDEIFNRPPRHHVHPSDPTSLVSVLLGPEVFLGLGFRCVRVYCKTYEFGSVFLAEPKDLRARRRVTCRV